MKKSNIEIIELFKKNLFLNKTIRELALLLKKDYPTVYNSFKELSNKKIIKIKVVGKSKVCELNLNRKSISILSYLDLQEALSKKLPNIERILDLKELLDDVVIVTGSYAKGKENPKSDIDLLLITKEKAFDKQKLLENSTALFLPKFHIIVITYKDFIDMLLDKKPNFGKEAFNNHLIFRNAERYYELIREAVENGFRS